MLGILWFLFWQALGVLLAYKYFAEKRLAVRLWLGSAAGTVLSMWAPIPFAFLMGFTRGAHLAGLGGGFIIAVLSLRLHRKTPFSPDADEPRGDRPLIFLLPPFLTLCVYLLCTHTLSSYGGELYSGQCSYGDMCMHLGFITSMAEQGNFPFEYSILPGSRLCYPFLCDSEPVPARSAAARGVHRADGLCAGSGFLRGLVPRPRDSPQTRRGGAGVYPVLPQRRSRHDIFHG